MRDASRALRRPSADVVRKLAAQTGRSVEEAEAAYERELESLDSGARVKMFVPVFAQRLARKRLKGHY